MLTGCGFEVQDISDLNEGASFAVFEDEKTEAFTEPETDPQTDAEDETKSSDVIIPTDEEASDVQEETEAETFADMSDDTYVEYHFRTKNQLEQHFQKHGSEFEGDFDYDSAEDYEKGASDVINNPEALFKTEAEDGDGVYYIEITNEFVILSTDGYIRTYFRPSAGKKYFDRQ